MARAAVGWTTRDLAAKALVGVNTINRFEAGQEARAVTTGKIRETLEKAGVEFIPENGGGPGVRLRDRSDGR